MDAMRRAALASMKRKKPAAVSDAATAELVQQYALPGALSYIDEPVRPSRIIPSSISESLLNVPRGPKSSKPHYHDIDAPTSQAVDIEEGQWGEDASPLAPTRANDDVAADPRQAKRAKFSYSDDYSWDVDAPSGDVDLEAPLPSLEAKPITRASKQVPPPEVTRTTGRKRRLNAMDLMELSGASTPEYQVPIRQKPFLPNTDQRQRLVVEYSDDEDESEGDVHGKTRQASTTFIAHIYKQLNGSEDDVESSKTNSPRLAQGLSVNNPATQRRVSPSASSSATSSLSRKEEEIREMMAKIQELEKRRGLAPSEPQVLADAARVTLEAANAEEKAKVVGFLNEFTSQGLTAALHLLVYY